MKDRQTRAQGRIETLNKTQEEFAGEMRVVQAGLSSLSDTPNLIRTLQVSLDQADKAIAELKDRHDRSATRIEAQASRQDEFHGELSTVKTGLSALSDTPNQIRMLGATLDAADNSIAELRERQARSSSRLDAMDSRQDEMSGDMTQVKAGLTALSDMPNLLRGIESALENAEKSITEIKDRNARAGARLEALGHRQQELTGDVTSLKTGLAALGEMPNQVRTLIAALDEADKSVAELRERGFRMAARTDTLAANLGDLTGKLDTQAEAARVLDERLRENERQIAKANDRERALAQLHARAADALRTPEAGG
jgi:DNA repair exonuclease SbcCD ATPase subunit